MAILRGTVLCATLALIFMIPWEDMIVVSESGTTGARVVGLLVSILWGLWILISGRVRKPHLFHLAVAVFIIWNVVSSFWTIDISATLAKSATYLQLAIMAYIIWDIVTSHMAFHVGLLAYVLGAYIAIANIVVNFVRGNALSDLRFSATGFNENTIALIIALGIPIAWHLAHLKWDTIFRLPLKFLNYTYLPIAIFGILLTASRGGFLAAAAAMMSLIWIAKIPAFQKLLALTAVLIVLLAFQPLVPESSFTRLATTGSSIMELDLGGRVDIWREGVELFSRRPLLGSGSGAFNAAVASRLSPHNTFLSVLAELGIVGLMLFVFISAIVLRMALRQPPQNTRLWISVLAIWLVGILVMDWDDNKQTWLIFSLIVASAHLVPAVDTSWVSSRITVEPNDIHIGSTDVEAPQRGVTA